MTRALVPGAGLPNTVVFPEDAKEVGREFGLVEDAITLGTYQQTDDGAGVKSGTWQWGPPQRGRIDPLGGRSAVQVVGGQLNESSTHIVTLYGTVDISTKDRVRAEGVEWLVTAVHERTQRLVSRAEVRQA